MSTCTQCNTGFEITDEENKLRDKISSHFEAGPVPPPTQCPDCRMRRKMAWRNETILYNRKCDKTGKPIISMYSEDVPFPVYSRSAWWGDSWNAEDFGRDYDFSRPFFEQFKDLLAEVPRPALVATNIENSDYCNFIWDSRNSFLSYCIYKSESLLYSYWMYQCKDSIDSSFCFRSERLYECVDCNDSYNCKFCTLSHNCSDSSYLYDCRASSNCFASVGLRNKQYCMFNEQLTKDEYERRLTDFDLQNPDHVKAVMKKLNELRLKHPHLYSTQDKTEDCTGDYVFESKDCLFCYQLYNGRDCIYVQDSDAKDCLDAYHVGWSSFNYEAYSTNSHKSAAFSAQCDTGNDLFYSYECRSISHGFGCVGLRNKEYYILNKKYSKEEYESLLPRIVEHMKQTGEWGEFFPVELSPFAINETVIQDYYPLTKDEILKRGWRWKDDLPFATGGETAQWNDIPVRTVDVPDSIVNEVLACEDCRKNFKIIRRELKYYKDEKLLLPRKCPLCRNTARIALRNRRELFDRTCDKCQKPIQTSYSPDRPEIVYCEQCYLKEVY